MKLLVIGHSVIDHIHFGNRDVIQPGGIFYTAAGLNSVKSKYDKFYLLTSFDKKNRSQFSEITKIFDLSLSNEIEAMPVVHLNVHKDKERDECYQSFTAINLKLDDKFKLIDLDGILINMITGYDLSLEQLTEIRQNFSRKIYLDIHTLSRSIEDDKTRKFRTIPNAEHWLQNVDIVQANEYEVRTLGFDGDQFEIAEKILSIGPSVLLVTKGDSGVRAFVKHNNEILSVFEPAIKTDSVNNVGCGDVFGAIFFYSYIKTQNIYESLRRANRAASIATTYTSAKEFSHLKNDLNK